MSGMDLSGIDLTTEVVRSQRLVLRPFTTDDVEAVFAGCQDPEVQRWWKDPRAPQPSHARAGALHGGQGAGARCAAGVPRRRRPERRVAAGRPPGRLRQEGVLRSHLAHRDGSRGDAALLSRLPGD
ncbi:GNAT family N-acetyltransferase [Modestobacter excelsi]|uniref:GNAT family N-acetyltransferase n=1 Tax=Modestobacter excelsi TaxID=2213161 RepID=UPI00110CBFC7|nr:GNAT family N-acetyltransferase [Modestobacter excelsi]